MVVVVLLPLLLVLVLAIVARCSMPNRVQLAQLRDEACSVPCCRRHDRCAKHLVYVLVVLCEVAVRMVQWLLGGR